MTDETRTLALPDEVKFRHEMEAINRFQKIVHATMVPGLDYGVIPGTTKPTLLKPGAEKIIKLLGLADRYEFIDRQEDWKEPFFRYLIRVDLLDIASGVIITQGYGECNSKEAKYAYRWLWPSELPDGFDKKKTTRKLVRVGGEMVPQYRIDNEDIFSLVNTLIKMAKKRALVDAALSAGRLSDVFTQDMEAIVPQPEEKADPPPPENIDRDWLKKSLDFLQWADVGKYLKEKYGVPGSRISEMVLKLSPEQQKEFVDEVTKRLKLSQPELPL